MARDPGRHTITMEPSPVPVRAAAAKPHDALAAPESDGLIGGTLAIWPPGAAWGTPDGTAMDRGSWLARFTRVLIDPFLGLYRAAFSLARESSVDGVDQTLAEWERDHGLPEPCMPAIQTRDQRIAALGAKVLGARLVTPSDFVRLALDHGFEVAIEEPAIFGCGASECGGEHECGAASQEVYVVVRIRDLAIDYFITGESETGHDRLYDLGGAEALICLLRKTLPAWVIPVPDEWRDPYADEAPPVGVVYGGAGFQIN